MLSKVFLSTAIGFFLVSLGGCVTGAQAPSMIPNDLSFNKEPDASVNVLVSGGQVTTTVSPSHISNENFQLAIETACIKSHLFKVPKSRDKSYTLNAAIKEVSSPPFGGDVTVQMVVLWELKDSNDKVLWKSQVKSEFKASFSESWFGQTRLRVAEEGAARQNIKQALQEISSKI